MHAGFRGSPVVLQREAPAEPRIMNLHVKFGHTHSTVLLKVKRRYSLPIFYLHLHLPAHSSATFGSFLPSPTSAICLPHSAPWASTTPSFMHLHNITSFVSTPSLPLSCQSTAHLPHPLEMQMRAPGRISSFSFSHLTSVSVKLNSANISLNKECYVFFSKSNDVAKLCACVRINVEYQVLWESVWGRNFHCTLATPNE